MSNLNFKDRFKLVGELDIKLIDPKTREVVDSRHIKNTIVDAGEIWIAELLAGETLAGSTLSYAAGGLGWGLQNIQVGTSITDTTQGMFKLQAQTMSSGAFYTSVDRDVSGSGNIVVIRGTFGTANGNAALQEAGIFSNTSIPTSATDTTSRMFNRSTFPVITKTTSFELALQWTITIGSV